MAIKNWHGGKLVIVWIVALGIAWFGMETARALDDMRVSEPVIIGAFLLLMIGPAAGALVVTWKWLSGKERQ
jgi:hypothetical protein